MKDRVVLQGGRLPSKRDLVFSKIGELLEANNTMATSLEGKFKPNPNQKKLFEMIEHSEVPADKWIHMLLYGPRGCLDQATFIPYAAFDSYGDLINKKGGTIQRFYERFHRISVGGKGKNRFFPEGTQFYISSVDENTGIISRNRVLDVIDNGMRKVFRVITNTGRSIDATSNHPFLTPDGYIPLEHLKAGHKVLVHTNTRKAVGRAPRKTRKYVFVKWHGVAGIKVVNGYVYHRLALSRATVEANINSMTLEAYLAELNSQVPSPDLKFLPRSLEVHHIDGNCQNDVLSNLQVVTPEEHHALHEDHAESLLYRATEEEIVSIIPLEEERRVYDICMEAPRHNFVANGFFVHNSGKSIGAYAYTIDCLTKYPGSRALGVRTTSTDIKDSIYGDCIKFLNRYGIPYTPNISDTTITLANGSVFRMRSDKALTDSHSDKSHALGSTSYNIVIFEEADSISQELAISMAGSMRHPGKFRKVIFYLCNPPSKRHWLWKMFHESNDPYGDPTSRRRALYCAAEDNVQHVGTGYVEAMREDFGMNPNLAKRLGYGLPGADVKGTPYFAQDFVKSIHVSEVPLVWNPAYPMQRGWDFGFEGMALVVLQADPDLNQIRVFRAILEQHSLIDPFCEKWLPILDKEFPGAIWEDYGDPAGRQQTHRSSKTDFDVMKEHGLRPKYSMSGVAWGLSVISKLLRTFYKGRPKLFISPEAELLVEAFEGGYCNMKGVTDTEPRPKKDGVYDHIFDAFRYTVVCLRQPSIEYVKGSRAGFVSMGPDDDLFGKDLTRSNVTRNSNRYIQVPPRRGFGGSLLNG